MTVLTMLCWGSWANVVKLAKNWRFELLYFDYAAGVLLASAVAGVTFGSMGSYGRPFFADLAAAGARNLAFGFFGGVIFNLSNLLVVGAIAIAGLGVAFPIGVGLALVVGVVWNYIINPQGNPSLLFSGVALVVAAMVLDGIAYRSHASSKLAADRSLKPGPGSAAGKPVKKGIVLSVVGGILMGAFFPLVEIGKSGEKGLGPYGIGFVFAVGVFLSTFVFNLYFMARPVEGKPLTSKDYWRGSGFVHRLGLVGGVMWATGTLCSFVAASAPRELQVGPAISYALGQGSAMIGTFWGVFVWHEFAGGGAGVKAMLALMFVLFLSGLGLVSIAPLFAAR
jgi:glucose uptake protein